MSKTESNIKPKASGRALRLFNGRSHGRKYQRHHVFVAATSMSEAARLVSMACFDGDDDIIRVSEIKNYYSKDAWGNRMKGIVPTEPCVYLCEDTKLDSKPFRVI